MTAVTMPGRDILNDCRPKTLEGRVFARAVAIGRRKGRCAALPMTCKRHPGRLMGRGFPVTCVASLICHRPRRNQSARDDGPWRMRVAPRQAAAM